jgi:hypothetical protein
MRGNSRTSICSALHNDTEGNPRDPSSVSSGITPLERLLAIAALAALRELGAQESAPRDSTAKGRLPVTPAVLSSAFADEGARTRHGVGVLLFGSPVRFDVVRTSPMLGELLGPLTFTKS